MTLMAFPRCHLFQKKKKQVMSDKKEPSLFPKSLPNLTLGPLRVTSF